MIGAVLWDLDGTLVDSEDYHWRAWRETMAAEGVSITTADFRASFGQRNDSVIPLWLGNDVHPEEIQRIGQAKEEYYRCIVQSERLTALPGAKEWLHRLEREGWRQAIASSAPRRNIEVVLEVLGLARFFRVIVSAEDVQRGKPDPQVFILAATQLGVLPTQCVVVEDSVAGIVAAKQANMRSIGVGRVGASLGADLTVVQLSDLPSDVFATILDRRSRRA